jgi:hypothetical protein
LLINISKTWAPIAEVPPATLEQIEHERTRAEQGDPSAKYDLGMRYLTGNGVRKNKYTGLDLIRKSAYQGHTAAQIELARCYYIGRGVERNARYALRWLLEATGTDPNLPDYDTFTLRYGRTADQATYELLSRLLGKDFLER